MKLTVPPLDIAKDEGFATEKDIFERRHFGERLASLIANADDNLVLALDSQWGEGKSTFIQMWRGYVENHRKERLKTVYFDAFANDYQKDPFLALASEIYAILPNEAVSEKTEFREKASNAAKAFTRGAIKIGIKAISGGLLDGSVVDSAEKEISDLISDQVDTVIADKFKSTERDKLAIKTFKEYLGEVSKNQGNGLPLVFIIDELDRCRPDFALDLIEQVKHLFSVNGITFLLVLNKTQLEGYVRSRYGNTVDAPLYLQKFINIWLNLPRKSEYSLDFGVKYFRYALSKMNNEDGGAVKHSASVEVLEALIKLHKPSYREIERVLSYFALLNNMSQTAFITPFQFIMAFVCYMKGVDPGLLDKVCNAAVTPDEVLSLMKLDVFDDNSEERDLYLLANFIKYDLSSDEVRGKMLQNNNIGFERAHHRMKNATINVCNWLKEININSQ